MKLRRWFLHDDEKLVRIKSIVPSYDKKSFWWPTMLIDRCAQRQTVSPEVNFKRFLAPFRKEEF